MYLWELIGEGENLLLMESGQLQGCSEGACRDAWSVYLPHWLPAAWPCGLARSKEQAALCMFETTNQDSANIEDFLFISELLAGIG